MLTRQNTNILLSKNSETSYVNNTIKVPKIHKIGFSIKNFTPDMTDFLLKHSNKTLINNANTKYIRIILDKSFKVFLNSGFLKKSLNIGPLP
jgi:hypothetical protein